MDWNDAGYELPQMMAQALKDILRNVPDISPFTGRLNLNNVELPYPYVIGKSGIAVPLTGTTSKTSIVTLAVPALNPNSKIIGTVLVSATNNANSKTLTVELNGTVFVNFNIASNLSFNRLVEIYNAGSVSSQKAFSASSTGGVGGGGGTALALGAVNTAVPTTLTITGTLANSADTMTVEGYHFFVLP